MTNPLETRGVEYVAGVADGIERKEEKRITRVQSVVADANQIDVDGWNGTFDGVEVDEDCFDDDRYTEWLVGPVRHLLQPKSTLAHVSMYLATTCVERCSKILQRRNIILHPCYNKRLN